MLVRVDLSLGSEGAVTLEEPEDCRRFSVVVAGRHEGAGLDLDETLRSAGVGWLKSEHAAYIRVDAIRTMASGRVDASWEADLGAMVDYARSKNWVDPTGEAVEGHLEWAGP